MCFYFLYKFCPNHLSFQEEFCEISSKMSKRLHVKYPFCRISMKFEFSQQIFEKAVNSNFNQNRPMEAELLHADRRTCSWYSLFAILRTLLKTRTKRINSLPTYRCFLNSKVRLQHVLQCQSTAGLDWTEPKSDHSEIQGTNRNWRNILSFVAKLSN